MKNLGMEFTEKFGSILCRASPGDKREFHRLQIILILERTRMGILAKIEHNKSSGRASQRFAYVSIC